MLGRQRRRKGQEADGIENWKSHLILIRKFSAIDDAIATLAFFQVRGTLTRRTM
jgi:hypothetical protein